MTDECPSGAHLLQYPESSNTLKRITIGKENILLSGLKYQYSLSRQLNPVSRIVGEDQTVRQILGAIKLRR